MTRYMKIALSAATALSLTLTPVPAAAADRDDVAGALAGLIVLGIIANAASDNNNSRTSRATQRSVLNDPFSSIDNRNQRRDRVINGNIRRIDEPARGRGTQGYKKAKLPDRCLRVVESSRSDRLVYVNRCLNRYYKFASKLPARCERFVRTNRGTQTVYASRCLASNGWRVARR